MSNEIVLKVRNSAKPDYWNPNHPSNYQVWVLVGDRWELFQDIGRENIYNTNGTNIFERSSVDWSGRLQDWLGDIAKDQLRICQNCSLIDPHHLQYCFQCPGQFVEMKQTNRDQLNNSKQEYRDLSYFSWRSRNFIYGRLSTKEQRLLTLFDEIIIALEIRKERYRN